jgi:hypothetical protein
MEMSAVQKGERRYLNLEEDLDSVEGIVEVAGRR